MFQEIFNDINNFSIHWVLTLAIALWNPTPKVKAPLGVWGFILTLSYIPGSMRHDSWTSLLARNLASPCLGRESKARVVTPLGSGNNLWWGEGWFFEKGGFPRQLMEPLDEDKVVSPRKVVSLGETLQLRMMISLRIGCSTMERREWGFPR